MTGSRYYRDASFNDGRGGMDSTSTAAMDAGQAQANELPTWGVHGGRLLDGCSFQGYANIARWMSFGAGGSKVRREHGFSFVVNVQLIVAASEAHSPGST
ncbi:hypothetical protein NL676_033559 [Syzygium grande]|nr:hypothetical protein NL676_033559 [Syzygium grande]